ncbi:hypothetical protein FRB96_009476 [Tulasnella sp. 330]|nr:hypothetical protein FRB96_009476 [Tulasnella sp. 330]
MTTTSTEHDVKFDPDRESAPSVSAHSLSDSQVINDPNWDITAILSPDESPYAEVRAAVANIDDPEMPCSTIRAWAIGLVWAILISGLNQHVLVGIMANVGFATPWATEIVATQRVYYNQTWNFSYQWLIVMGTQLIGFSFGGICRRFLVAPAAMIWPANLVYCTLLNTLHQRSYAEIDKNATSGRYRFFLYVFGCSFIWYFLPGYLFTALSYFSWVCWIAPKNIVVNQLFGTVSGLGMSLITFDWAQIAYIGSPLATPWWAEANVAGGFLVFFWIVTPILYYTNTWYSKYLPISSRTSFDNKGKTFNVTRILAPDATLDVAAYNDYSPLYISTTFAVSYGLAFAASTATIVHVALYYRKQLRDQLKARRSGANQPDIHQRLMSHYSQVPDSWFVAIFGELSQKTLFDSSVSDLNMHFHRLTGVTFVISIISFELWKTEFPVWAFIVSIIIAFVYTVPVGIILALTNQQLFLNVITELIAGYILPGKPIAMMMFKTYGSMAMAQAVTFTSDMKLGHYLKVPPRVTFCAQLSAAILAGTVQLGVQAWMFSNIPGMCGAKQSSGFICPRIKTFGTASIIWGVVGPHRMFSPGALYSGLLWFFLVGALLPVGSYLLAKKYPKSAFKYVNFPVVFTGTGDIPPATAINYVPWAIVGFVFQFMIRRRHFSWWSKYNYVLSAALDSSIALSVVVIFFCLQYPRNGAIGAHSIKTWWGNTVYTTTADGTSKPLLPIPASGTFGLSTW